MGQTKGRVRWAFLSPRELRRGETVAGDSPPARVEDDDDLVSFGGIAEDGRHLLPQVGDLARSHVAEELEHEDALPCGGRGSDAPEGLEDAAGGALVLDELGELLGTLRP